MRKFLASIAIACALSSGAGAAPPRLADGPIGFLSERIADPSTGRTMDVAILYPAAAPGTQIAVFDDLRIPDPTLGWIELSGYGLAFFENVLAAGPLGAFAPGLAADGVHVIVTPPDDDTVGLCRGVPGTDPDEPVAIEIGALPPRSP